MIGQAMTLIEAVDRIEPARLEDPTGPIADVVAELTAAPDSPNAQRVAS